MFGTPSRMLYCSFSRTFIVATLLSVSLLLPVSAQQDDNAKSDSIEALLKRVENGDAQAQYEIGERYLKGDGVDQNPREATSGFAKQRIRVMSKQ